MLIAYITFDDVNRFTMRSWARPNGVRISCPTAPLLRRVQAAADGVVLDLDYLPTSLRTAWMNMLQSGGLAGRVLVHGHSITDAEAETLHQRGVVVRRGQLRREVLLKWVRGRQRIERIALRVLLSPDTVPAVLANGRTAVAA